MEISSRQGSLSTDGEWTFSVMNDPLKLNVIKASGEIEPFSEEKVRSSLKRAGADEETTKRLVAHVESELYDGISTQQIYNHIFDLLRKEKSDLASRYNLKKAIMELGPTGFPFERFVAGILAAYGYQVEVDQTIEGKCATHEIDVMAQKGQEKFMVECKYHNHPGIKCEIKTALYVYARFLDVQNSFNQGWLVTNTKITSEAQDYARCAGLKVISWDYPPQESLRFLIEKSGLHPITAMESLSKAEKRRFLERGIVFQKDLPKEFLKERGE